MKKANKIAKIKFYFLILIITLSILTSIYIKYSGIEIENIKNIIEGKWAPAYFIIIYTFISFIPLPFAPTMFLGGIIFPFVKATLYTLIGSIIFSTVGFYMARFFGRDYFEYLQEKNKRIKKLDIKLRQDPFENLLLLRFFFIFPAEIINLFYGMSKIRFRDYILATIIGNIPVIICSVGLIRSQLMGDTIGLILSISGFIVLLLTTSIFSRRKIMNIVRFIK